MRIPLDSFEQYIDEKILTRGLSYWKSGHVSSSELLEPGKWEFTVYGTEDYIVNLHIINNVVHTYSCTCPYDMGNVCKHVVAVLFELQKDVLFLDDQPTAKGKSTKSAKVKPEKKAPKAKAAPKRKTVAQQIEELLEQASEEELRSFVRDIATKDRELRSVFMQRFGHLSSDQSRSFYAQQIRALIKSAAGRDGYIEYGGSRRIAQMVGSYLENARVLAEKGNLSAAINSSTAVAEEMCAALQYADDSNGSIGDSISEAITFLEKLANSPRYVAAHEEIFTWFTEAFRKKTFGEWDWHFNIIRLAINMATDNNRAVSLIQLIDSQKYSDFWEEEIAAIRFKLIKQTEGEKTALHYLDSNLRFTPVRRLYLQLMFEDKQFDEVISVAREGIQQAKDKKLPGLVNEWHTWLLKTAQIQKDTEGTIKHTTYLFMNSLNSMEYYDPLKKLIQPSEWPAFIDTLIDNLRKEKNWRTLQIINEICIREQRWNTLLENLQSDPSLHNLEAFSPYLIKFFPDKLAAMYEVGIRAFLEQGMMGRPHYRKTCDYLRSMQRIAGDQRTAILIADLKSKHANKPALLEELTKL